MGQTCGKAVKPYHVRCRLRARHRLDRVRAFGQSVMDFQNTRHALADIKADLSVGWAYFDQCLERHVHGELGGVDASIAKLWCTEHA